MVLPAIAKPRVRGPAGSTWFTAGQAPALRPRAQFDATKAGRRLRGWMATGDNINSLLAYGGDRLLKRSRDLVRNNGYASNACDEFESSVIGCGITPSSKVKNPALKAAIEAAWLEWTDEADADGLTDLYGLMALAARGVFEAGECFVRFRPRFASDDLSVPLQLQLLEAEMLPWEKNEILPNGNIVRLGIEFSAGSDGARPGSRVAYWFYRRHPGDSTFVPVPAELYVRVPATEILHLFKPLRPGQIRGVPRLTPAMIRLRILDDLDDAQMERQRVAAMFAGFIKKLSNEDEPLPEKDPDEATNREGDPNPPMVSLEPGTMQELLPGEDLIFSEPPDAGSNYEPFQYRALLAISSATGIPYPLLTGDLRQVNYSSIRSGLIAWHRRVEQLQHQMFVFQMCRPIWQRWLRVAIIDGRLPLPANDDTFPAYRAVEWLPPPFAWVDPVDDVKAEILQIRAGLKSRTKAVAQRGWDRGALDDEIEAEQKDAKARGLVFPELEKEKIAADGAARQAQAGQGRDRQAA